ncbi:hypothetical protein ACHHYP_08001 [Achlya hypogyna]|uniref:Uncharacterized protein n=1 Tax=Achlya hypogyna TaxID=1202772 RepID=A0A1V9YQ19_ACHHY|nr:hypothetical protein ACHHYP_08001 [Achlya hypogyna]
MVGLSLAVEPAAFDAASPRPCSPRRKLSDARAKDREFQTKGSPEETPRLSLSALSNDAKDDAKDTPRMSLTSEALRKLHISIPPKAEEKILSARKTSECFVSDVLAKFSS